MLDILPPLGAKAAADIVADDPDFALRHLEDHGGQHVADAVGIVDVGIERVAVLAGIVSSDRAARLHVLGLHPADHVAAPDDMSGAGEGSVGLGLVAPFIGVGNVVGVLVPNPRCVRPGRIGRRGDRGQRVVIDLDQFGGVLCLRQRLRNDHRDGVADIAGPIDNQRWALRREHRRPVGFFAGHPRLRHREPVCRVIGTRINRSHTRRGRGDRGLDRPYLGMCMGRPQKYRIELPGQVGVVLIPALALEQPRVLETGHRLADTELHHREAPGSAFFKIVDFP